MDILRSTDVDRWRDAAACRGMNPNIFYPEARSDEDAAKRICRECVVQNECITSALINGEKDGIWGGSTPKERTAIMRNTSYGQKIAQLALDV